MFKFFMLLFLIICGVWTAYLKIKGYSLRQGLKGYGYIFLFHLAIIAFFSLMILITSND
jgi:hypothetical protein